MEEGGDLRGILLQWPRVQIDTLPTFCLPFLRDIVYGLLKIGSANYVRKYIIVNEFEVTHGGQ